MKRRNPLVEAHLRRHATGRGAGPHRGVRTDPCTIPEVCYEHNLYEPCAICCGGTDPGEILPTPTPTE